MSAIVSHSILIKSDRKVILSGSIHTGYAFEKNAIQKNIVDAEKENFLFLREGIDITRARPKKLSHKLILFFVGSIGEYHQKWSELSGDRLFIERELEFKNEVITVDLKEEIITKLAEHGLTRYWPLIILFRLSLFSRYLIFLSGILMNFLIDQALTIFLEERDSLVIDTIENSSAPNIYVHYGDSHIAGMRNKLISKGWQVSKESLIKYRNKRITIRDVFDETYAQIITILKNASRQYIWQLEKYMSDH